MPAPKGRHRGQQSKDDQSNSVGAQQTAQNEYGPLEQTYDQCSIEARSWFYVSVLAAIAATITTIVMVIELIYFILTTDKAFLFVPTLSSMVTSMITGVITYLVFSQKRYANERVDSYADKINEKADEASNAEKMRDLIEVVLESHLSKEDQSYLIKEIISRRAFIGAPLATQRKDTELME
ncbi:hypothetical protein EPA93_22080 [Ktedonosporobacter rubrisoli]|uniref:Uncharacterized protein n=1 Tax=Ktedonosporobacter rubrisoli TaxID=2509675 RepID=A0A4P6JUB9_KTERU|nr:hypothetical protein [Ktedonosporobacter rubrisoli]QBD78536.1 hypothetical protein EPA93_22080 [Ktedonosporobacter rubrisoli]